VLNWIKTYGGSEGIAPLILNLRTWWRSVIRFKPRPLYTWGNDLRYPFDARHDRPQNRSVHCREEKNLWPVSETEPRFLGRPTRSLSRIGVCAWLMRRVLDCMIGFIAPYTYTTRDYGSTVVKVCLLIRFLAIDFLLLRGNMFTESLPIDGYTRHNMYVFLSSYASHEVRRYF
jgi:hypothetical protein